jgi:hypothetical protein
MLEFAPTLGRHVGPRAEHKAGAGSGVVRGVGKLVKWVMIVVGAGLVAALVLVAAAVFALGKAADRSEKHAQHAAAGYALVREGMTPWQVRRIVGSPETTDRTQIAGAKQVCWYYGSVLADTWAVYCFERGKLVSKTREF